MSALDPTASTLYEEIGGQPVFDRLVRGFYRRVQQDEVLWPMYPQHDLEGAIWRLSAFLAQFFGGPTTYSAQRGHPRLRMRHLPFRIDHDARDRWLTHMSASLDELVTEPGSRISPMHRLSMLEYFDRAAHAMVNTLDTDPGYGPAAGGRTVLPSRPAR